MKVQMQGQHLRLRVDEAELARLQAGDVLENLTRLPEGIDCRQQIRLIEGSQLRLNRIDAGWCLQLPRELLEAYVARLPCREGLELRLAVAGSVELVLGFEVDVRDSVRNRGVKRRGDKLQDR